MSIDPGLHNRRSIRIPEYDYSAPGRYYVTICTRDREYLFGEIRDGHTILNEWGQIVQRTWDELPDHYPNIVLDAFVIMPNHVHGVIGIYETLVSFRVGAQHAAPLQTKFRVIPGSLGAIVRSFKSAVSQRINAIRATPARPVWQRNYYEHVVRNERDLNRIRQYIAANPAKWESDRNNPVR